MCHHNKDECHYKAVGKDSSRKYKMFVCQGQKSIEIHHKLVAVYDEHAMSSKQIFVWCIAFTEEYTNLQNRPHVGCSYSSTTLIQDNR